MASTIKCPLAAMLLLTVSCSARAQEVKIPDTPEKKLHLAPAPSDRFPAKWYPRVGDGTDVVLAPVTDHPYTAVEGEITRPAGEAPRQQSPGFEARDRLGRTRSEAESGGFGMGGQEVKTKTVLVSDPVAHCDFQWQEPVAADVKMPADMRVAVVTCRPQTLRYKDVDFFKLVMESMPEGTSQQGDTTTQVEPLAPVTIDGLTVNRMRVHNSRTDDKGEVKSWSRETWYAPEIREVVRMGDEKDGYTGLSHIQLLDPDPALFYPPEGYRIALQAELQAPPVK